jgi:hypothetical protein
VQLDIHSTGNIVTFLIAAIPSAKLFGFTALSSWLVLLR